MWERKQWCTILVGCGDEGLQNWQKHVALLISRSCSNNPAVCGLLSFIVRTGNTFLGRCAHEVM